MTGTAWRSEVGDPMIRLTQDNPTSEQAADVSKSARSADLLAAFKSAVEEALKQAGAWSEDTQRDQDRLMSGARLALVLGGLTTLTLALFVGWWMTRSIARPVTRMTAVMKKLAGGD